MPNDGAGAPDFASATHKDCERPVGEWERMALPFGKLRAGSARHPPKLADAGREVLSLAPMSTLAEIESAVRELPPVERVRFVEWLDENRRELLPAEAGEPAEIAEAQRREVLRRRDELLANPALAQGFDDEYFNRLRQKIADVRAGKASAG